MALYSASSKWQALKKRVGGYSFRKRVSRLWEHLQNFRTNKTIDQSATSFVAQPIGYVVDFFFYMLDIFAVGEFYETLCDWAKYNTRALNAQERAIVKELFNDAIDVDRVRIDEFALAPRFMRIAYVGVYTINSFGRMSEDLFVHELIHIWQYEKLGSAYIPRALRAQRSVEGYNYGGVDALRRGPQELLAYNYEQQGDILADYWRAKHKRPTRWKNTGRDVEPYIEFVEQVREKKC